MMEFQEARTSERLAKIMNTNPVVVRRVLAGLRESGFVQSEKGHGGGWILACDPTTVSLFDVYKALGSPPIFALGHRSSDPQCLIEQAVNAALEDSFRAAQTEIFTRLQHTSLATLAADFHQRRQERFGSRPELEAHTL